MSGPAPKRQKVDAPMGESTARRTIKAFCGSARGDIVECWQSSESRIVDCFREHPNLLLDKFDVFKTSTVTEECSSLEVMVRCGANLSVVKELHQLCPEAPQELINNTERLSKLFEAIGPSPQTGAHTAHIDPEVLEFLIQHHPEMARKKVHNHGLLLEFLLRMHEARYATASVVKAAITANPEALKQADLLGILVQGRCRKPQLMEALVDAMIDNASTVKLDAVSLCDTTRRELYPMDAQIIPQIFGHIRKLTVPLSFDNATHDILRALAKHPQNSIKELVLEMASRSSSGVATNKNIANMLKELLASDTISLEKLMLKSRHLPYYYGDMYPMDNWMVQLFRDAERLPPSLKHLEFSGIELDEAFDLKSWLRTPNLPATVAFSGLKVKGTMESLVGLTESNPPPVPTGITSVKHLEFFAEGDKEYVTHILTRHVGSATHLESLSLGFSQVIDVTEAVRSLMRSDGFKLLELHANTILDLPAFCDMLRGNRGLRKFHKLQYPKQLVISKLENVLEHDNATLSQFITMTSRDQMPKVDYFLTLNQYGRRQAHNPSIPLEGLIALLGDVVNSDRLNRLQRVNTNYGLLRESQMGTWSMAAAG